MMNSFGQASVEQVPVIPKPESVLDNFENEIKLARIFSDVYKKRPEPSEFVGAMADSKKADKYKAEQIKLDEKYVENKRNEIEVTNSSYGREELNRRENSFAHAEIAQAMLTDLINKVWFKDFEAIMTADYDDLKAGVDTVLKSKEGSFLGLGFDFTISEQEKIISKKLSKEWTDHVSQGKIATVKYYKDPDTGYKGSKMTPKFIVGSSEDFVEEGAKAYLSGDQESLINHPMRQSFLNQIETQLDYYLEYFKGKLDGEGGQLSESETKKFEFTNKQYLKVKEIINKLKEETSKADMDALACHVYSKESVAENAIKKFYNPTDNQN